MRIRVRDIEEVVKDLVYDEPTDALNALFEGGPVHDYELAGPANVEVSYYRSGQELFVGGTARSSVVGQCARCLESFTFMMTAPFTFVLVPKPHGLGAEPQDEDLDLSFYEGEEVDLAPLVRERILLALPTLPLCDQTCRGLCPRCGVNLNNESCVCPRQEADGPFAVLRQLKLGR
jgi:uncharacterized protein